MSVAGDYTLMMVGDGGSLVLATSPLSLPVGTSSRELTLTALDDTDTTVEVLNFALTAPVSGAAYVAADSGNSTATIRISPRLDNVVAVTASLDGAATRTVSEDAGTLSVSFSLALAEGRTTLDRAISLPLSLTAGTATLDDYSLADRVVVFDDGASGTGLTQTVDIEIVDDGLDEEDEGFTLALATSLPQGVTAGSTSSVAVTITDNDTPSLALSASADEVTEGGQLTLTLTSSVAPRADLSVALTPSGTGVTTADYTLMDSAGTVVPSPLSFPENVTAWTLTLTATDDGDTGTEAATLTLSSGTGYELSTSASVAFDIVPRVLPVVSVDIGVASIIERESVRVRVSADRALSEDIQVPFTISGTGISNTDYTLTDSAGDPLVSPLRLTAAARVVDVTLTVVDDDDTATETLTFALTTPVANAGYTLPGDGDTAAASDTLGIVPLALADELGDARAPHAVNFGTAALTVSEDAGSVDVSVSATVRFFFNIRLSQRSLRVPLMVTADTATAGDDYVESANYIVPLVFSDTVPEGNAAAGTTVSGDLTITLRDDDLNEPTETFTVSFGTLPSYLIAGDGAQTVTVTVTDDDLPALSLSAAPATISAGERSTLTLQMSAVPAVALSVPFDISGVAASDYTLTFEDGSVVSSPLSWPTGQSAVRLLVSATMDDDRVSETLTLTLGSAVSGYSLGIPSRIDVNINPAPTDVTAVTVGFVGSATRSAPEGGSLDIQLRLSATPGRVVNVPVEATAGSATNGEDYVLTSGTVSFIATAEGDALRQSVSLNLPEDSLDESEETFTLSLGSPLPAGVSAGGVTSVEVTITDNDVPRIGVIAESAGIDEGTSGTLTLRASTEPATAVTVNFALSGTASPADYTLTDSNGLELLSSVTLGAGETEKVLTLTAVADADTAPETVVLTLSAAASDAGYALAENDTVSVTLASAPPAVTGLSAVGTDVLTLSWTDPTNTAGIERLEISWTPDAPSMPIPLALGEGTYTISGLDAGVSYTVTVESVSSSGTLRTAATASATTWVPVELSFGAPSTVMEDAGTASVTVVLSLPAGVTALDRAISVPLTLGTGGSATIDEDYTALASTPMVTFAANASGASLRSTVTVANITDDAEVENREGIEVLFGQLPGNVMATGVSTSTITIEDNDAVPPVSNLNGERAEAGTVVLSWNNPSGIGAENFSAVEVTWVPSGSTPVVLGTSATTYRVEGLPPLPSGTYAYTVTAVHGEARAPGATLELNPVAAATLPSPVTDLSAEYRSTGTSAGITLSWTAPEGMFTGVDVSWTPGGTGPINVSSGVTTYNLPTSALTAGTEYTFTLVTVDSDSNRSAPVTVTQLAGSITQTVDDFANRVTFLSAVVGDRLVAISSALTTAGSVRGDQIRVRWQAMNVPAGREHSRDTGEVLVPVLLSSVSFEYTVDGLYAGRTYQFSLTTVESATGEESGVDGANTTATPQSLRPPEIGITVFDQGAFGTDVVVVINPVAADIDRVDAGYSVERILTTADAAPVINEDMVTLPEFFYFGLTADTLYTVAFRPYVTVGGSRIYGRTVTARFTPTAGIFSSIDDGGIMVIPGDGQVSLSWVTNIQLDNGYTIAWELSSSGESMGMREFNSPLESGESFTATITGLTNGLEYTFIIMPARANATNPTVSATPNGPPVPTPAPVTGLTARLNGTTTVVLNWTAPVAVPGVTPDGALVRWNGGGNQQIVTGAATTATVSGLTAGTAYDFEVVAMSSVGALSEPARVSATTPAADPASSAPDPVTGLTATAGNAEVTLAWTLPSGVTVTAVNVSHQAADATSATDVTGVAATATTATVTSLTNGTSYTFIVSVTSADGTSVDTTVTATPSVDASRPPPVTGLTAVAAEDTAGTDAKVTLTWAEPTDTASFDHVEISQDGVTIQNSAGTADLEIAQGTTTHEIVDLDTGSTYTFSVVTVNAAGTSSEAVNISVTTPWLLSYDSVPEMVDVDVDVTVDFNAFTSQYFVAQSHLITVEVVGTENPNFEPVVDITFTDGSNTVYGTHYQILHAETMAPLALGSDNNLRAVLSSGSYSFRIRGLPAVRALVSDGSFTMALSNPDGEDSYFLTDTPERTVNLVVTLPIASLHRRNDTATTDRDESMVMDWKEGETVPLQIRLDRAPTDLVGLRVEYGHDINDSRNELDVADMSGADSNQNVDEGNTTADFSITISDNDAAADDAFEPPETGVLVLDEHSLHGTTTTITLTDSDEITGTYIVDEDNNTVLFRVLGEAESYFAYEETTSGNVTAGVDAGGSVIFSVGVRHNDGSIPTLPIDVPLSVTLGTDTQAADYTLVYADSGTAIIPDGSDNITVTIPEGATDGRVGLILRSTSDEDTDAEQVTLTLEMADDPNADIAVVRPAVADTTLLMNVRALGPQALFLLDTNLIGVAIRQDNANGVRTIASEDAFSVVRLFTLDPVGTNSLPDVSINVTDPRDWITAVRVREGDIIGGFYRPSNPPRYGEPLTVDGSGNFDMPLLQGRAATYGQLALVLRDEDVCAPSGAATFTLNENTIPPAHRGAGVQISLTYNFLSTACPPVQAVSDLTASQTDPDEVTLSWTDPPVGYDGRLKNIEVSYTDNDGTAQTEEVALGTQTVTLTDLVPAADADADVTFTVLAVEVTDDVDDVVDPADLMNPFAKVDADGPSSEITLNVMREESTDDTTPPAPLRSLQANETTSGTLQLDWIVDSDETDFARVGGGYLAAGSTELTALTHGSFTNRTAAVVLPSVSVTAGMRVRMWVEDDAGNESTPLTVSVGVYDSTMGVIPRFFDVHDNAIAPSPVLTALDRAILFSWLPSGTSLSTPTNTGMIRRLKLEQSPRFAGLHPEQVYLPVQSGDPTSYTFRSLTNGVDYTITVTVVEGTVTDGVFTEGEDAASEPGFYTARPYAQPVAYPVTELTGTVSSGSVTLSWTDPTDNTHTLAVTHRLMGTDTDSGTMTVAHGVETATLSGLTNGQAYEFTVTTSRTASGMTDTASRGITLIPVAATSGAPDSVSDLTVLVGEDHVSVRWTDPTDLTGVSDIEVSWLPYLPTLPLQNTERVAVGEGNYTLDNVVTGQEYTLTVRTADRRSSPVLYSVGQSVTARPTPPAHEERYLLVQPVDNVRVTALPGYVDFVWDEPASASFDRVLIEWTGPSGTGTARVDRGVGRLRVPDPTDERTWNQTFSAGNYTFDVQTELLNAQDSREIAQTSEAVSVSAIVPEITPPAVENLAIRVVRTDPANNFNRSVTRLTWDALPAPSGSNLYTRLRYSRIVGGEEQQVRVLPVGATEIEGTAGAVGATYRIRTQYVIEIPNELIPLAPPTEVIYAESIEDVTVTQAFPVYDVEVFPGDGNVRVTWRLPPADRSINISSAFTEASIWLPGASESLIINRNFEYVGGASQEVTFSSDDLLNDTLYEIWIDVQTIGGALTEYSEVTTVYARTGAYEGSSRSLRPVRDLRAEIGLGSANLTWKAPEGEGDTAEVSWSYQAENGRTVTGGPVRLLRTREEARTDCVTEVTTYDYSLGRSVVTRRVPTACPIPPLSPYPSEYTLSGLLSGVEYMVEVRNVLLADEVSGAEEALSLPGQLVVTMGDFLAPAVSVSIDRDTIRDGDSVIVTMEAAPTPGVEFPVRFRIDGAFSPIQFSLESLNALMEFPTVRDSVDGVPSSQGIVTLPVSGRARFRIDTVLGGYSSGSVPLNWTVLADPELATYTAGPTRTVTVTPPPSVSLRLVEDPRNDGLAVIQEGESVYMMLTVEPVLAVPLAVRLLRDGNSTGDADDYLLNGQVDASDGLPTTWTIPASGELLLEFRALDDADATAETITYTLQAPLRLNEGDPRPYQQAFDSTVSVRVEPAPERNVPTVRLDTENLEASYTEGESFTVTVRASPAPETPLNVNFEVRGALVYREGIAFKNCDLLDNSEGTVFDAWDYCTGLTSSATDEVLEAVERVTSRLIPVDKDLEITGGLARNQEEAVPVVESDRDDYILRGDINPSNAGQLQIGTDGTARLRFYIIDDSDGLEFMGVRLLADTPADGNDPAYELSAESGAQIKLREAPGSGLPTPLKDATARGGNGEVKLSWEAPTDRSITSININYCGVLEIESNKNSCPVGAPSRQIAVAPQFSTAPDQKQSVVIKPLLNGSHYQFELYTMDSEGSSMGQRSFTIVLRSQPQKLPSLQMRVSEDQQQDSFFRNPAEEEACDSNCDWQVGLGERLVASVRYDSRQVGALPSEIRAENILPFRLGFSGNDRLRHDGSDYEVFLDGERVVPTRGDDGFEIVWPLLPGQEEAELVIRVPSSVERSTYELSNRAWLPKDLTVKLLPSDRYKVVSARDRVLVDIYPYPRATSVSGSVNIELTQGIEKAYEGQYMPVWISVVMPNIVDSGTLQLQPDRVNAFVEAVSDSADASDYSCCHSEPEAMPADPSSPSAPYTRELYRLRPPASTGTAISTDRVDRVVIPMTITTTGEEKFHTSRAFVYARGRVLVYVRFNVDSQVEETEQMRLRVTVPGNGVDYVEEISLDIQDTRLRLVADDIGSTRQFTVVSTDPEKGTALEAVPGTGEVNPRLYGLEGETLSLRWVFDAPELLWMEPPGALTLSALTESSTASAGDYQLPVTVEPETGRYPGQYSWPFELPLSNDRTVGEGVESLVLQASMGDSSVGIGRVMVDEVTMTVAQTTTNGDLRMSIPTREDDLESIGRIQLLFDKPLPSESFIVLSVSNPVASILADDLVGEAYPRLGYTTGAQSLGAISSSSCPPAGSSYCKLIAIPADTSYMNINIPTPSLAVGAPGSYTLGFYLPDAGNYHGLNLPAPATVTFGLEAAVRLEASVSLSTVGLDDATAPAFKKELPVVEGNAGADPSTNAGVQPLYSVRVADGESLSLPVTVQYRYAFAPVTSTGATAADFDTSTASVVVRNEDRVVIEELTQTNGVWTLTKELTEADPTLPEIYEPLVVRDGIPGEDGEQLRLAFLEVTSLTEGVDIVSAVNVESLPPIAIQHHTDDPETLMTVTVLPRSGPGVSSDRLGSCGV